MKFEQTTVISFVWGILPRQRATHSLLKFSLTIFGRFANQYYRKKKKKTIACQKSYCGIFHIFSVSVWPHLYNIWQLFSYIFHQLSLSIFTFCLWYLNKEELKQIMNFIFNIRVCLFVYSFFYCMFFVMANWKLLEDYKSSSIYNEFISMAQYMRIYPEGIRFLLFL